MRTRPARPLTGMFRCFSLAKACRITVPNFFWIIQRTEAAVSWRANAVVGGGSLKFSSNRAKSAFSHPRMASETSCAALRRRRFQRWHSLSVRCYAAGFFRLTSISYVTFVRNRRGAASDLVDSSCNVSESISYVVIEFLCGYYVILFACGCICWSTWFSPRVLIV